MIKKYFLLATLLVVQLSLSAAPVTTQHTESVARRFMNDRGADFRPVLRDVPGWQHIRLYTSADGRGFVLISADDCVLPVLGYSTTGRFEARNMPAHISQWLSDYDNQIDHNIRLGIEPSAETRRAWAELDGTAPGTRRAPGAVRTVSALLPTTWDQSLLYNDSCPGGSYAGCIAIAQAQIMRYWRHPATGYGSHSYDQGSANFGATTYDWANMPPELDQTSTATEISAVAQLVYHIGVAVEMSYSTTGSGAQDLSGGDIDYPSSENAYRNYFRYAGTVHGVSLADYGDLRWKALLRSELDAGRPVQYSGQSTDSGHAFVVDGYDAGGNFHINWGWGSYCDGYFAIGQLNPAPGGAGSSAISQYNIENEALVGICPDRVSVAGASVTINAVPNVAARGTVTGGGTYTIYADTVQLAATATAGYRMRGWSSGVPYNPFIFVAAGSNRTDTALFEPVTGDTLYYCRGGKNHQFGFQGNPESTWGVRFVPSSLTAGNTLSKVSLRTGGAGNYTIKIYSGGTNRPGTLLSTDTLVATGDDWEELTLRTPLTPNAAQNLWVVVTSEAGISYPMCTSTGMAQTDGYWIDYGQNNWDICPYYEGSAWQIRAIFSSDTDTVVPPTAYTVNVTVDPACQSMGHTEGSGQYNPGESVRIAAVAGSGYEFDSWTDGNTTNPRYITVTSDTTFTCRFRVKNGVDVTASDDLQMWSEERTIIITNVKEKTTIEIYNIDGRQILSTVQLSDQAEYTMPDAGIYMVVINGKGYKVTTK